MADNTDISQAIPETGADSSSAQLSQSISESGSDESRAQISQAISETGAAASTAQISQLPIESGASASAAIISQLTIELGRDVGTSPPGAAAGTFAFDEGGGVEWWIIPQLTDSSVELRDKVIKAVRVTGLVTNADVKVYTYGPGRPMVVSDLEDGLNARAMRTLPDTTEVTQSPRRTVNCPNAMLSTVRVAGVWDGEGPRNRVDEIVYEVAQQGVRR